MTVAPMVPRQPGQRRAWLRRVRLAALLSPLMVLLLLLSGPANSDTTVYTPRLDGVDRLVTNEFAHFNPAAQRRRVSADWEVTSGSLFIRNGVGWTGTPDGRSPDVASTTGTGSDVFRMHTRRSDFGDVAVSLKVRNLGVQATARTPASDIDGIHLFLRYHSPSELYVVSLNRRDDTVVVKKKTPGGDVNGGTYVTLGEADYRVPYQSWQFFAVRIRTEPGGVVAVEMSMDDQPLLTVRDTGQGGPPILDDGALGLRGDNCEFEFTDFIARPL